MRCLISKSIKDVPSLIYSTCDDCKECLESRCHEVIKLSPEIVADQRDKHLTNFIGCFSYHNNVTAKNVASLDQCTKHCRTPYISLLDSIHCTCSDEVSGMISLEMCHEDCICQGHKYHSVFSASSNSSTEVGCFSWVEFEFESKEDIVYIEDQCMDLCLSKEYHFMAIKDLHKCFCGNSISLNKQKTKIECFKGTPHTHIVYDSRSTDDDSFGIEIWPYLQHEFEK
ncbi:hypothetical protein HELRODRAFT_177881 [Helobdella robusta]|uniref:WSC domain-containing protein n=1 Tax=Helobdella robusta TaxID=6412 RepID=T1FCF0_HELRO|nr:hypothetical protein HELRODRAFT_177881 [Helobdella robusta]ESN97816.1 hypothetical protein HELRODRAFT_177881 [Helobdella robusta]